MKSIMTSVSPYLCEKIASGDCKILVRKSAPKEVPFKDYIYCTKAKIQWRYSDYEGAYENSDGEIVYAQQHIIGEFICDKITQYNCDKMFSEYFLAGYIGAYMPLTEMCLTQKDLNDYGKGKKLYGLHISDLKIYDKPKELSEFYRPCSYSGICYSCNRFRSNGTPNDKPNDFCDSAITRPPISWQYVEELRNE